MVEIDRLKEKIMRYNDSRNNRDNNAKHIVRDGSTDHYKNGNEKKEFLSSSQSVNDHRVGNMNNSKPKLRSSSDITLIEQQQINSENENNSWSNQMMKKKHHPTKQKPKK
jgi:hypothetical protein